MSLDAPTVSICLAVALRGNCFSACTRSHAPLSPRDEEQVAQLRGLTLQRGCHAEPAHGPHPMWPPKPQTDPYPVMSSLQPLSLSPAVLQARQAVARSPGKCRVTDCLALAPRAPATDASPLVSPRLAQINTTPDSLGKHVKLHSRLFLSGGLDAAV